jgi:branched-subunit amino acid aminotransferase/4-amino-4-deoxychorismate lyase
MEVAEAKGIEVRLEMVPVELAYNCDEIFMCTTMGGIMPITWLDGSPAKGGEVGPVTKPHMGWI